MICRHQFMIFLWVSLDLIKFKVNNLSVDDLKVLLKKLKIKPIELVRQKESVWIENFKDKKLTNLQIINKQSCFYRKNEK